MLGLFAFSHNEDLESEKGTAILSSRVNLRQIK
jgi:hypothetical protein